MIQSRSHSIYRCVFSDLCQLLYMSIIHNFYWIYGNVYIAVFYYYYYMVKLSYHRTRLRFHRFSFLNTSLPSFKSLFALARSCSVCGSCEMNFQRFYLGLCFLHSQYILFLFHTPNFLFVKSNHLNVRGFGKAPFEWSYWIRLFGWFIRNKPSRGISRRTPSYAGCDGFVIQLKLD